MGCLLPQNVNPYIFQPAHLTASTCAMQLSTLRWDLNIDSNLVVYYLANDEQVPRCIISNP
jgi:hypothetical protein